MTTNAQVVQLFTDVLTRWNEREAEFRNWQAGTAEGGPNADGRYPLTNGSNETYLVASPAKLASTVSGPAVLSEAAQVAAEAAQFASETASTQSNNSRILSENHKNAALAARDLALLYRDQCAAAQTAVLSAQVSIDAALVVIEDNVEITEALANETLEARDDTLVARAEAMVARDQAEDFAASINPATLATKAELQSELSALIDAAPGTLNTLNEIAAALGDDPNFATTVTNSVAGKAPLVHSHVISDVTGLDTALAGKQPVGNYVTTAGNTWDSVLNKPSTFPPSAHVHTTAQITGLDAALDGKQPTGNYSLVGHGHVIADVSGLQTALDGKQASGSYVTTAGFTWAALSGKPTTFTPSAHTHVISEVTGLQSALDGKLSVVSGEVNTSRVNLGDTSKFIRGGGAGQTILGVGDVNSAYLQVGGSYYSIYNAGNFDPSSKSNVGHTHVISEVSGLQAALDGKQASLGFTPYNASNPAGYITSSASITGSAGSIAGFNNPTIAPTGNTIVYRDGFGDIAAREIILSSGISNSTPTVLVSMFPTTNQLVRTTPTAVAAAIQGAASGTWGINVTGNAATVTSVTSGQVTGALGFTPYNASNPAGYITSSGSISGNAATATFATTARLINSPDGDRSAATKLPTTSGQSVRFDFVGAGSAGTGGNYAGVMTYAPWTGDTASTGDASYQLAFGSTAANGGGIPMLNIRKGIDSTWNSWYTIYHSGNFDPANYLPKTGGTINGSLTINGNAQFNDTSVAQLGGGGVGGMSCYYSFQDAAGVERGWAGFGRGTTTMDFRNTLGQLWLSGTTVLINDRNVLAELDGKQAALGYTPYNSSNPAGYITSAASISGNAATATNLSTVRSNWSSNGTISAVVGQLAWKHFGNNHTIFDASNGTAPDGTAVNNANAGVPWSGTYPTLMGWNGGSTYGVRVDSARIADNATTAGFATKASTLSQSGGNGAAMTFYWSGQGGQPTWLWGSNNGTDIYVYNPSNFSVAYAATAGTANDPNKLPLSGGTVGRINVRTSGVSLGSGNSSQIEINNAGSGACNISFHREGAYGAHFGLDTDNVFSTFGWSAGSGYTSMRVGNFTAYGSITATDNVTAYSDERLKENIQTISGALSKLGLLKGVTYTRNDLTDTTRRYGGLIAQDVQKVLPEAVTDIEGTLGVDYNATIGLLVEAIKELTLEVEELKARGQLT